MIAPPAAADLGPLEPLADLHRSLHESLGLPEPLIVRLLERGLPEPELPAIGWIARETGVAVDRVAELRLAGAPLIDVAIRLGGSPAIFYVPFEVDPGPPYGRAWGLYKRTPRDRWSTVRLADVEVIQIAHLHLVTRQYGLAPFEVVELRRQGKEFPTIHRELRAGGPKGKGPKDAFAASAGRSSEAAKGPKKPKQPKQQKPPKADGPPRLN